MKVFRNILVGVGGFVFLVLLFSSMTLAMLNMTVGTSAKVKALLKDGGVYENIVPAVLKQVAREQSNENSGSQNGQPQDQASGQNTEGEGELPIDKAEIIAAAQKGFSPQLLQTNAEVAIDAVFVWLNGGTEVPKFALDLSSARDGFAEGVGDYAVSYINSLPVCAPGQEASATEDDLFNATCRPESLNAEEQAQKVTAELKNGDFLKETTISSESLKLNEKVADLQQVPKVYQFFKWSALICGFLALLAAIFIVIISPDHRKGLSKVAVLLLAVGALSLTSVLGFVFARNFVNQKIAASGDSSAELASTLATPMVNALAKSVNQVNIGFGIALILLAGGAFLYLHLTRPKAGGAVSHGGTAEVTESRGKSHESRDSQEADSKPEVEKTETGKKDDASKKADEA